jgi:hypothetical protein
MKRCEKETKRNTTDLKQMSHPAMLQSGSFHNNECVVCSQRNGTAHTIA